MSNIKINLKTQEFKINGLKLDCDTTPAIEVISFSSYFDKVKLAFKLLLNLNPKIEVSNVEIKKTD